MKKQIYLYFEGGNLPAQCMAMMMMTMMMNDDDDDDEDQDGKQEGTVGEKLPAQWLAGPSLSTVS